MKTSTTTLTKVQRAWLERWSNGRVGPGGEFTCPYVGGFEAVSWKRMAARMCAAGMLEAYVHGGFKITDAGRAALETTK